MDLSKGNISSIRSRNLLAGHHSEENFSQLQPMSLPIVINKRVNQSYDRFSIYQTNKKIVSKVPYPSDKQMKINALNAKHQNGSLINTKSLKYIQKIQKLEKKRLELQLNEDDSIQNLGIKAKIPLPNDSSKSPV